MSSKWQSSSSETRRSKHQSLSLERFKCPRQDTLWLHRTPTASASFLWMRPFPRAKNATAAPVAKKLWFLSQRTLPPCNKTAGLPHHVKLRRFLSISQSQKANSKMQPKSLHIACFPQTKSNRGPTTDLSKLALVSWVLRRVQHSQRRKRQNLS